MTYRSALPQLSGEIFLTDGGIETDLIFNDGLELPSFAAIDLMRTDGGRAALEAYYRRYLSVAEAHGLGFVLESATWRASPDWESALGYPSGLMADLNEQAIELLARLRDTSIALAPIVISGCVGPRGDGYQPGRTMTSDEAAEYHARQIRLFAETDADQVTAITMNYVEEAVGVARAAAASGMLSVISFTLETDGRLPTGQPLAEAIAQVDDEVGTPPAYYMINCAHPSHFEETLASGRDWTRRIRGLRGNASKMSHEELDRAETLDDGDPGELGSDYARILGRHSHINVLGGCCGTDRRHIAAIADACVAVTA